MDVPVLVPEARRARAARHATAHDAGVRPGGGDAPSKAPVIEVVLCAGERLQVAADSSPAQFTPQGWRDTFRPQPISS